MNIDLNSIRDIPHQILEDLAKYDDLFLQAESTFELYDEWGLAKIVIELDRFCLKNRIIGLHYTRANKSSILSKGLLLQSGNEFRQDFLATHGHVFTSEEIVEIKKRWLSHFEESDENDRDLKIYFNFTDDSSATDQLLDMCGGEQVTMCFDNDGYCAISEKLSKIGEPLIIKCSIDPAQVNVREDQPWGRVLLSSYHKHVNSLASRVDFDGFIRSPVSKNDIVEIITLTNCSRGIRNAWHF